MIPRATYVQRAQQHKLAHDYSGPRALIHKHTRRNIIMLDVLSWFLWSRAETHCRSIVLQPAKTDTYTRARNVSLMASGQRQRLICSTLRDMGERWKIDHLPP